MKTFYLLTNDPNRIVVIPPTTPIRVVEMDAADLQFRGLTNTLKAAAMREAREVAKAAGLRLRKPETMFA